MGETRGDKPYTRGDKTKGLGTGKILLPCPRGVAKGVSLSPCHHHEAGLALSLPPYRQQRSDNG